LITNKSPALINFDNYLRGINRLILNFQGNILGKIGRNLRIRRAGFRSNIHQKCIIEYLFPDRAQVATGRQTRKQSRHAQC